MNDTLSSALFETAHGAATFAYRFSSQQYPRSAMAIRAQAVRSTGKGLAGIDGAAQAGMIQAMARDLGRLQEAIIIAKYAPLALQCSCDAPCCSGLAPNLRWREAVRMIADLSIVSLPGCVSNSRLRQGVVRKHYGEQIDIGALADLCEVHRNTASNHSSLILRWLRGRPAKGDRKAELGVEHQALLAFDEALSLAGLIGSQ